MEADRYTRPAELVRYFMVAFLHGILCAGRHFMPASDSIGYASFCSF